MERQLSFAQSGHAGKRKTTRRDKFLAEMEAVVPWARLVALIAPHYPAGRRGRPPLGVERMLRICFLQQGYGLADEALEDAIYDSQAMRGFVGADLGLVHRVTGTAAHVSDLSQAHALLHGEEQVAHADAGYTGVEKRPEIVAQHPGVAWRVALKRGQVKALAEGWGKDLTQGFETLKARVRARGEHPFHIVKNLFHHRKVRYRGLAKNTAQLQVLFALANLVIAKRALLAPARA